MEKLEFPRRKIKLLPFLLAGLIFLAAGGIFLSTGLMPKLSWPPLILGALTLLLAVWLLSKALKSLLDGKPGLTLSSEGIEDRTGDLGAGFIPWQEVTEIQSAQVGKAEFIGIALRDPQSFIAAQKGAVKRKIMETNLQMLNMPVLFAPGALPLSQAELLDHLRRYWLAHRK